MLFPLSWSKRKIVHSLYQIISSCVQMRDRDCQGIRGIVGLGDGIQLQQGTHHFLHLSLLRTAISCHSLLDFIGVYSNGSIPACCIHNMTTPRACPTARAVVTFREKNNFSTAAVSG